MRNVSQNADSSRGYALLDALTAMVLFSVIATAMIGLAHDAKHHLSLAKDYDRARIAGETVLADLEAISWHRLQETFSLSEDEGTARIGSGDGSAPPSWDELVADLREGRVEARLEALGRRGAGASFKNAVALRIRVETSFGRERERRKVRLTHVRF